MEMVFPSLLGNPLKEPADVNTTSAVNMQHLHSASLGDLSPLPCEKRGVLRQSAVPVKKVLQHHCPREAGLRQGVTDTLQKPHLRR